MTSLEWTPGSIRGVIASECIVETRQEIDLPVYGGHFSQSVPALLDASVTGITGTVNIAAGDNRTSVEFFPDGENRFSLTVPHRQAIHDLEITAELAATLDVPRPPMLHTVHHPARTDVYTRRVTCRCGKAAPSRRCASTSTTRSTCGPWRWERAPVTRARTETLPLAPPASPAQVSPLGVGADRPFEYLTVPPPKPPPPKAEQAEVGDSGWWGWPW